MPGELLPYLPFFINDCVDAPMEFEEKNLPFVLWDRVDIFSAIYMLYITGIQQQKSGNEKREEVVCTEYM